MRGINSNFGIFKAIFCGILAASPALYGQASSSSTPVPETEATGWRRLSFGGRVNGYPFNLMRNKNVTVTPSATVTEAISTANNYQKISYGPSLEFRITHKFAVNGELLYHRLNYTQTNQITDTVNGNTGITENTRASLWDLPVMLRYRGLGESGFLSKFYFAGGGALRRVGHISTSTVTNLPNGSTTISSVATVPSKRDLPGAVVGVGLRLVDDFNIKLCPEIRYTRWMGGTFDAYSTHSDRNQLEIGIGLTF